MAPDGNTQQQVRELRKKTMNWTQLIAKGNLTKGEVYVALTHTITKRVEYPLSALNLTQNDCKRIMGPIIAVGLPKAGIPRTAPVPARHAPVTVGGYGIPDLHLIGGTRKVATVIDHLWTNSPTGFLIESALESLQ